MIVAFTYSTMERLHLSSFAISTSSGSVIIKVNSSVALDYERIHMCLGTGLLTVHVVATTVED